LQKKLFTDLRKNDRSFAGQIAEPDTAQFDHLSDVEGIERSDLAGNGLSLVLRAMRRR
jgi:hypothetical protein